MSLSTHNDKMTGRERIMAAITGQPTDRAPWTALFGLYGATLAGCSMQQYYHSAEDYLKGQARVVDRFGPDMLLSPLFMCNTAEAFGGQLTYFDDGPPNLVKPAVRNLEQFKALKVPDMNLDPSLLYLRTIIRGLKAAYGDTRMVGAIWHTPMEIPIMIMGMERWMDMVVDRDEGAIATVLDTVVPFFVDWVNALFEDGADCVIMPAAFTSGRIVTPSIIDDIVLPVLTDAFAKVKGPLVMHHVGGPYLPTLKYIKGLPNVIGYAVDATDDLDKCRDAIGKEPVIIGNLDGPTFDVFSPDTVYNRATNILESRRDDRHFMLATTGPDIPMTTPEANVDAIAKALKDFN